MNDFVLDIKNLNFAYKKNHLIFENFNLNIKKGELKTILGKSGSGKSTLFELILGNLKAQSGEINKKSVSIIFQDPFSSFHPTYTIYEQIKDVLKRDFKDEVDTILPKLKLEDSFLYKKPFELSGGQLQRCSILRAILQKPDLILLDEPTSALDNITAYETMKLILTLLDSCAILLVTHDLDLASWCSDNIIRLENGK
ncbi:putative D,D-dipeptide transport ATP-binding protein DdpF [Aliarcobacter thereius]|uniref:ATP-binding cassette domain-containing protein n=2 Tax=Aliarcobacter thereius TaxID=544718 RepID=A0A1C0B8Z5_9BACT|nr:ATP-binding cassette domain-containing protein [Aliarcobacter thereius]OCL88793.1 putative D,D-dipeptide transport ATP-binding protein DdpF [Aliarcobacter thereius]OCL92288.1 putative D,D-dipeptide transport ATP-binding protein DdpF [Aliarcobacter thereius]OCL94616.1 putative D,D-dipeptide transport ATP-binding protein DdpF [Aliarcobacter thereius LMG 24486]OCM00054.1 putative D,D-dipeptide transport ATP-binding protein DdpF [Aliarcobacter thereius]QBF15507.1 ABC transporter, ATP-binding pr